MKTNQEGFSTAIIVLVVAIVGLVGWSVVKSRLPNSPRSSTTNSDQTEQHSELTPKPAGNSCATGRIIVYFKDDLSKARQQEIIAAEKTTISREYESLNGYALNVTKNQETTAAQAFLKHTEVKTAAPEECPGSTNSVDTAN